MRGNLLPFFLKRNVNFMSKISPVPARWKSKDSSYYEAYPSANSVVFSKGNHFLIFRIHYKPNNLFL